MKIIFYFQSSRHSDAICASFPFDQNSSSNENSRQYTTLREADFEAYKKKLEASKLALFCNLDNAGNMEAKILEIGFHSFLSIYLQNNN